MKKTKDLVHKKNPLDDPKTVIAITTGDSKIVKVPGALYRISSVITEDVKTLTISNADALAIKRVKGYYTTWISLSLENQGHLIAFEYLNPPKKTRRKKGPTALSDEAIKLLTPIYNTYKCLPKSEFFILLATAKSMKIDTLIKIMSHIIAVDVKSIEIGDGDLLEIMQNHYN